MNLSINMKLWRKIYDSFITRMYGCRKVRYLQENAPYVNISYEINEDVLNVDHLNADEMEKDS